MKSANNRALWLLLLVSSAAGIGTVARFIWVKKPIDELCFSNGECRSNRCHRMTAHGLPSGYCTVACDGDDDCGGQYLCKSGECLRRPDLRYGERCQEDEQCISNLCTGFSDAKIPYMLQELYPLLLTEEALCTRPCDRDCAECRDDQRGASVCFPKEEFEAYRERYKQAQRKLYPEKFKAPGAECILDDQCRSGLCQSENGINLLGLKRGVCTAP